MNYKEALEKVKSAKIELEEKQTDLKFAWIGAIKCAYECGYFASTDYHINRMRLYAYDTVERIYRVVNYFMCHCSKYHEGCQLVIKWRNQNSHAVIGAIMDNSKIVYEEVYNSLVPHTRIEDAYRLIIFKRGVRSPVAVTYEEFVELGMAGKYND